MFSQVGQDEWVRTVLKNKQEGFFVELGAADGKDFSNSLFFETFLDWNGICIEPNPKYENDLRSNRKCHISTDCVSSENDRIVEFADCDLASGIVETAGPFTKITKTIQKRTKTLGSILDEFHAPSVIDYLSLDVEGHEYEILRTFPFDKYKFRCITVEHNEPHQGPEMRMLLRGILEKNGYRFVKGNDDVKNWGHGPIDDFYVHPQVVSN